MPPVKSADRAAKKWARVSQGAQAEYEEGVRNPRADWAEQTRAAEANFEQGIQKAIGRKSFGKGVAKAGTAKWQAMTLAKGPARWAGGIAVSEAAYEAGVSPYLEVIKRTVLPPRGPKGDPKNIQRVQVLADALHKEKLSRQGV